MVSRKTDRGFNQLYSRESSLIQIEFQITNIIMFGPHRDPVPHLWNTIVKHIYYIFSSDLLRFISEL